MANCHRSNARFDAVDRTLWRWFIEGSDSTRIVSTLAIGILICCLLGCAPKVKFTAFDLSADKTEYQRVITQKNGSQTREAARREPAAIDFFLRGSTIVIAKPKPDDGSLQTWSGDGDRSSRLLTGVLDGARIEKVEDLKGAEATTVPLELDARLYRAMPNENFLYNPNISVAYGPRSLLLASIGTDSVDQGAKLLQVVGAIAAAVIVTTGFDRQPGTPETLRLPVVIDVRILRFGEYWKPIPDGCENGSSFVTCETWWYRIDRAGPDIPAEDVSEFLNRQPDWSREFPYAVCQDIRITIGHSEPGGKRCIEPAVPPFRLRVAHPSRVRSYLIPQKGEIKFQDVCGADIVRVGTEKNSLLDDLQALADAVKQIKDARSSSSSQGQGIVGSSGK